MKQWGLGLEVWCGHDDDTDRPPAAAAAVVQIGYRATLLQRNGALPARETCELIVLDRSVDPVAPVIHEWTYEALVYDLLSLDDNIIRCVCVCERDRVDGVCVGG